METKQMRLILLLAASGRTNVKNLAESVGIGRSTAFKKLSGPYNHAFALSCMAVIGRPGSALSLPVEVGPKDVAMAIRRFKLDMSRQDLTGAVGGAVAEAILKDGAVTTNEDGRVVLAQEAE